MAQVQPATVALPSNIDSQHNRTLDSFELTRYIHLRTECKSRKAFCKQCSFFKTRPSSLSAGQSESNSLSTLSAVFCFYFFLDFTVLVKARGGVRAAATVQSLAIKQVVVFSSGTAEEKACRVETNSRD